EFSQPFRHFIYTQGKFIVLLFKKDVHGMKIGAFHVPVGVPCFHIQYEFIGQQYGQNLGYFGVVFYSYGIHDLICYLLDNKVTKDKVLLFLIFIRTEHEIEKKKGENTLLNLGKNPRNKLWTILDLASNFIAV